MANKAVQRLIHIKADQNGNAPSAIHLLSTGHWHTPWHGAFEHTSADLAEMVEHFDGAIGLVAESKSRAPINEGHARGDKAVGWITGLFLENDGTQLWGNVDWTKAGAQLIAEGEYAYISPEWNPREFPWEDPEEEGKFVENVFLGAALTNIPLFKKLAPLMASADSGSGKAKQSNGGDMNLDELRTKKLEELTDEENTFVTEHAADLSADERKAFELQTDEEKAAEEEAARKAADEEEAAKQGGDPKQASTGTVSIDAAKLASLEADAKAGRDAQQKLLRTELAASVKSHVDRGAIKSSELDSTVEMLMASSESARKSQLDFISKLPDNQLIAKEAGKASVEASQVEITKEEQELAEAFGNTPEQLKEYKKSQAEG